MAEYYNDSKIINEELTKLHKQKAMLERELKKVEQRIKNWQYNWAELFSQFFDIGK